jgi:thiamine-phosphate pyrophosphorylase
MEIAKTSSRKIRGGLYLVVDPAPGIVSLLPKIEAALEGGVDVIQLWNNWSSSEYHKPLIEQVCRLAHAHKVCVLINEHWSWLKHSPLDGVHFDSIPSDWEAIKRAISRPFIAGITCGNDQQNVTWAIENSLDYISFCSMFPSSTANSCELVNPESIKKARASSNITIFVSGGITLEHIPLLDSTIIDGIAVVSGIMKAEDPKHTSKQFKQIFYQNRNHNENIIS